MADGEFENADSQNGEEQDVDLSIDENETDIEVIKARAKEIADHAKKKDGDNKQLYARTKKAEGFELKDGKWIKPVAKVEEKVVEAKDGLSQKDVIALVRGDIHDDDIESVQKFAKMEDITVSEALKNEDLKAILERRASVRKTADVTDTSKTRRTKTNPSGDTLVKELSEGKIPEKGSEDAEALFWARRKKK